MNTLGLGFWASGNTRRGHIVSIWPCGKLPAPALTTAVNPGWPPANADRTRAHAAAPGSAPLHPYPCLPRLSLANALWSLDLDRFLVCSSSLSWSFLFLASMLAWVSCLFMPSGLAVCGGCERVSVSYFYDTRTSSPEPVDC